jgi:hypothetical protein
LPKLESHLEARLWNDIFLKAISSVRQAKEDQRKLAEQQGAVQ